MKYEQTKLWVGLGNAFDEQLAGFNYSIDGGYYDGDRTFNVAIFWHKMARRTLFPDRPRIVRVDAAFEREVMQSEYKAGYSRLKSAFVKGESLIPWMSKKVVDLDFVDYMMDMQGTVHFHLGDNDDGRGFVGRTKHTLFCQFVGDEVFISGLQAHNPAPWAKRQTVEYLHGTFPEALASSRVHGVSAAEPKFSDEERGQLWRAGANVLEDMGDGTVYMPIGGGLMGNRKTAMPDLWFANSLRRTADKVELFLRDNTTRLWLGNQEFELSGVVVNPTGMGWKLSAVELDVASTGRQLIISLGEVDAYEKVVQANLQD